MSMQLFCLLGFLPSKHLCKKLLTKPIVQCAYQFDEFNFNMFIIEFFKFDITKISSSLYSEHYCSVVSESLIYNKP